MSSAIFKMESKLASLSSVMATNTKTASTLEETITMALLEASIDLLSAQQVMSTATGDASVSASSLIVQASAALSSITSEHNPYGMYPSYAVNLAMSVIMGLLIATHTFLAVFFHTWWFGLTTFLGIMCELMGYVCKTMSADDDLLNSNYFVIQISTLTIAPAFLMVGVYYILTQVMYIYGAQYSLMTPRLNTWVFISVDLLSLLVQASGGGLAASNDSQQTLGTNIVIAGIAIQVAGMTVFIAFLAYFLNKIGYLRSRFYEMEYTGKFEPKYKYLRQRPSFKYWPAGIFAAVMLIYIRSIYRLAELSQGWDGYLITHEIYFFVLDSGMITAALVIFLPCHPGVMMGRGNPLKRADTTLGGSMSTIDAESQTDMNGKPIVEEADVKTKRSSMFRAFL